jgi:hypothetical protein
LWDEEHAVVRIIARLGLWVVLLSVLTGAASPQYRRRMPDVEGTPRIKLPPEMERTRIKNLNKERYEKLRSQTDKLLELATELKQQVDRADENMLSLDVIKSAENIEKLAKEVREKMKQDIGPGLR